MAAGDNRWIPPNSPSLSNQERFAFDSLSKFMSGDTWARFPTFGSFAEGRNHYGLTATAGDHFVSLATGDVYTTAPQFWLYTNSTMGWLCWDMDEWTYVPPSSGLTYGNAIAKVAVIREGRYMNIQGRIRWGSTTSASGGWAAVFDLPSSANTPGLTTDYQARFVSAVFPSEFNEHAEAEILDNSPLAAIKAGIRMESATTYRLVTMPTVVIGGSTYLTYGGISSTSPITFTTDDTLWWNIRFVLA